MEARRKGVGEVAGKGKLVILSNPVRLVLVR